MKVKSVYRRPLNKGSDLTMTRDDMMTLGRSMVAHVVREARRDFKRFGLVKGKGDPIGIPDTEDFFRSFGFVLGGENTVSLTCSWPTIDSLINGRDPFKMTWLTQERGVHVVPMKGTDNVVLFRSTPLKLSDAWIHPGVRKHNFIRRGIDKAKAELMKTLTDRAVGTVLSGDFLR